MAVFRPARVLSIIFGASDWPEFAGLAGSPAFLNSALGFQQYLKETIGVPDPNVLWLFDDLAGQTDIDKRIRAFLEKRTSLIEPAEGDDPSRGDVFVFFTGHGRISQDGKFQFILRSTRRENVENSGYLMRDLASTLDAHVLSFRRWVFLDCCFSGAAYVSLMPQAESAAALRQEADRLFPPARGTALFAACGGNEVALAPRDRSLTMFSDGLLSVLKMGDEHLDESISLEEISIRVQEQIQNTHASAAVRPILSAPDQSRGNTVKFAIFPNPARRDAGNRGIGTELQQLLDRISKEQTRAAQSLNDLENSLRGQFIQLTQAFSRGVKSLEKCQEDFAKQLWALSGEDVEIRHLGLDLFKASHKMMAMLDHESHVSRASMKVLVVARTIAGAPPAVKRMLDRVDQGREEVESTLIDKIDPKYKAWRKHLDCEIRSYAEIPMVHGFSIRQGKQGEQRHVVTYFSLCRWKGHDLDWGGNGYREFIGDLSDDSAKDMLEVFDGMFEHLWNAGTTLFNRIIGGTPSEP